MGFYGTQVFPRLVNVALNTAEARRVRAKVCAPLGGTVLEIGFGTGLNLPHLPAAVRRVLAVDPSTVGRRLAAERLAATAAEVSFVGLDGQSLPLEDASVDAALSTWTLCSIPDAEQAVAEIRRVLRPGGAFHFAEHGRAPDEGVRRWQHRLDPIQHRVGCGCSLSRDIPAILEAGGLVIDEIDTYYAKGEPKAFGSMYVGVARASTDPPAPR